MSEAGFAPGRPALPPAEAEAGMHEAAEAARDAILERAARAVGRIDRDGLRGITRLSVLDIEAMALAYLLLGGASVAPGGVWPPERATTRNDGESHE